jgi:hypothetical protein
MVDLVEVLVLMVVLLQEFMLEVRVIHLLQVHHKEMMEVLLHQDPLLTQIEWLVVVAEQVKLEILMDKIMVEMVRQMILQVVV